MNSTEDGGGAESLAQPPSELLSWAIGGLVMFLTFGLGSTLTKEAAWSSLKQPRAPLVGLLSQYGFMPLVAFLLAKVFSFTGYESIGLLITGASPGGSTSNLFCYLVKADVALSITMTVFSTLLSIGLLPLMLFLYTPALMSDEPDFVVPYWSIVRSLLFVLVPTSAGILLRAKSEKWAKVAERVGTTVGILFLVGALVTGIAENTAMFSIGPAAWIASASLQIVGYFLGYGAAWAARLTAVQRITVAFEVMVQNTVLSLAIVTLSFQHAGSDRLRQALTFPLMSSLWDIVWSCVVAGGIRAYMYCRDRKAANKAKANGKHERLQEEGEECGNQGGGAAAAVGDVELSEQHTSRSGGGVQR